MNSYIRKMFRSPLLALLVASLVLYSAENSATAWTQSASTGLQKARTVKTRHLFGEDFFSADKPDIESVGILPATHPLRKLSPSAGAGVALLMPPNKPEITHPQSTISAPDISRLNSG